MYKVPLAQYKWRHRSTNANIYWFLFINLDIISFQIPTYQPRILFFDKPAGVGIH